jgi:hypothetical protein
MTDQVTQPTLPHTLPHTLQKEISRLFQLGKNPVPYASGLSTMVMMLLYLNNKYGIEDKTLEQIKTKYREYGRFTKRQKTLNPAPDFYNWELLLFYDNKDRLIKSNRKEYYPVFYWKLRDMIDANPGQKIFCSFDISFYVNDKLDNGHIELVIYDPVKNTLEHVDSNQLPKHVARQDRAYFECCQITEEIIRQVAEVLPTSPKYINNHDYYGAYEYGIQTMEAASDLLVDKEKDGFCLMWMSLFAELALKFPETSMKDAIQTMFKKANSIHLKLDTLNDYFLFVIRGYVVDVSRTLDISFIDEKTIHDACVRLANL